MTDEIPSYTPPLRFAVLWASRYRVAMTPEALALYGGVKINRALAYASILVAKKVLRETGGGFVRGTRWDDWASSASRARPRHSAHVASDAMDAARLAFARNVRAEMAKRNWQTGDLARASGVSWQVVDYIVRLSRPPPFGASLLIAKALTATVDHLACNNCCDAGRGTPATVAR